MRSMSPETEVNRIVVGPLDTNCYIVSNSGECVIIDAGDEGDRIADFVRKNNLAPRHIFASHGHFDHIAGVSGLLNRIDCNFHIGVYDMELYRSAAEMARNFLGIEIEDPPREVSTLEGGEYEFGNTSIRALPTPGHTAGSFSFVTGDSFFTGDTLFRGSIGRMDLGGSENDMIKTLKWIVEMDDQLEVFPGHGGPTTLGEEKRDNPFLTGGFIS